MIMLITYRKVIEILRENKSNIQATLVKFQENGNEIFSDTEWKVAESKLKNIESRYKKLLKAASYNWENFQVKHKGVIIYNLKNF